MPNPRIQAIEQAIINLAQKEHKSFYGVFGDWARTLLILWKIDIEKYEYIINDPKWDKFITENQGSSRLEVAEKLIQQNSLLSQLVSYWKLIIKIKTQLLQEISLIKEVLHD